MKTVMLAVLAMLITSPSTWAHAEESPEANAAIVRAQLDMMNRGDWKGSLQYFATDTRNFGEPAGIPVMMRIFEDIYRTFPDWHFRIDDVAAVGDSVIVRTVTSGTHEGVGRIPVNGGMLVGVTPTNKHFAADTIHWYKMKNGKIVDHYATRDDLAMMQQLGLSPAPKPFDWRRFAADANKK